MNENMNKDTTMTNDTKMTGELRVSIPKWMFDAEYSTQRFREYQFLHERGIEPSYIKKSKQYNVTTFKYTKTPELFEAVAAFYRQLRDKKDVDMNA